MINLEHRQRAEQIRPPPRERVKPRAKNHVLREGASSQPVLGVPAAGADSRAGLATDRAGEQRIELVSQLLPYRADKHQGQHIVQYPRRRRLQAKQSTRHGRKHRRPARRAFHAFLLVGQNPACWPRSPTLRTSQDAPEAP